MLRHPRSLSMDLKGMENIMVPTGMVLANNQAFRISVAVCTFSSARFKWVSAVVKGTCTKNPRAFFFLAVRTLRAVWRSMFHLKKLDNAVQSNYAKTVCKWTFSKMQIRIWKQKFKYRFKSSSLLLLLGISFPTECGHLSGFETLSLQLKANIFIRKLLVVNWFFAK